MNSKVATFPAPRVYVAGREARGTGKVRRGSIPRSGCETIPALATAAWSLNLLAISRRTAYWFDRSYWKTPSSERVYENRTVGNGRMGKYSRGQATVSHEAAATIDVRFPGTLTVLDHVIWQLLGDQMFGPPALLATLTRCLPGNLPVAGLIRGMTPDDESESIRFEELTKVLVGDLGQDASATLDRLACLIALQRLGSFQMDRCRIRPGIQALSRSEAE
jgi:hypothetical protein